MSRSMRQWRPEDLDKAGRYHLMTACVVPRPIAWTSTVSEDGTTNLAPFSFFGGVSSDPWTVMLSVGRRRDGSHKDTARNILESGEAVIHISTRENEQLMVASSAGLDPDQSEIDHLQIATEPAVDVSPPRIADAAIALECRRVQHQEVGRTPVDLFLLEVIRVHVGEDVLEGDLPDGARLGAVGRLGGTGYCTTDQTYEIDRPQG
mgnify:FL=1